MNTTIRIACRLFLVVISAMAVDSRAATITNNNVSGYFTNSATWVGGVVPGAGDTAQIVDNNITVTIDGGNRTVQQLFSKKTTPTFFVLNMDTGATLLTTLRLGGTVIVSNGTLQADAGGTDLGGGNVGLIGGAPPGSLILSGGNFSQTNNALFRIEAGVAADSVVRVEAGSTFTFAALHQSLNLGTEVGNPTARKKVLFQVNGGTANLTTGDGYENIVVGKWDSADSVAKMTSIVSVASGTLNVLTNVAAPGGPGQRFIVGGRTGNAGSPKSSFDEHVAQVVVSSTGVLNVGGGGVVVGSSNAYGNTGGSAGELAILGGAANLNGLVVGDLGKLTQTNGILKFNAKYQFLNEATDSAQHLFMTGGLTLFQGVSASSMTINMGGASAGNVLGQGFYNVQFGSNGGSLFTINLSNAFYGCGTALGGNGTFGDGIKDLVIWTNTVINYNSITYSGTSGPNSLMDFATLATPWGWDVSVGAIPEPAVTALVALGGLLAVVFRRRA